MEIVGYARIKQNPKTGVSHLPISKFVGYPVRVYEFDDDGGVLVVNNEADGFATFDACDVERKFKCSLEGEYILPPDLINIMERMAYMAKVMGRKGGYNGLLRQMVIETSLHKGVFTDNVLFAKQRQDEADEAYRKSQVESNPPPSPKE